MVVAAIRVIWVASATPTEKGVSRMVRVPSGPESICSERRRPVTTTSETASPPWRPRRLQT